MGENGTADVAEIAGSFDGSDDSPQAWVGCLACYNAGRLIGAWVPGLEAGEYRPHGPEGADPNSVRDEVHEELWVMDHENYRGLLSGECSPAEAQRIAEGIEAIPDYIPVEAVGAWLEHTGERFESWEGISDGFEEAFAGGWESEQAYAENLAEELGVGEPEEYSWPASYIDWERAARDLFLSDYWSTEAPGGMVYVFRSS